MHSDTPYLHHCKIQKNVDGDEERELKKGGMLFEFTF